MKRLIPIVLAILLTPCWVKAADILVVVSADSPVQPLSRRELVDLYMGRSHYFPDGSPALKIDAPPDSALREAFYQALVNMSSSQVNAYWARLMFTGRATPPLPVANTDDLVSLLERNPSALGYLPEGSENKNLKTIFVIKESPGAP
ncbi:MAG: hypothetical protein GYB21_03305 [Oceanospirillales bacterium]|nr:hypothetical protein [Oceanospirillales bacterium]